MCPQCLNCADGAQPCVDPFMSNVTPIRGSSGRASGATPIRGSSGRAYAMIGVVEYQEAEDDLHPRP